MNRNQAAALRKKIENYATSMVADSWRGSADPEDYEAITSDHQEAKQELERYLATLVKA